jgi:predicted DNA-binding WGR domain protein
LTSVPENVAPASLAVTAFDGSNDVRMRPRYFEFVEGSSSKFWSIELHGSDVTVRYGRIGTNGQEKTKSFPSQSAAQKYYDEIVAEKVEKGYQEK